MLRVKSWSSRRFLREFVS